MADNMFVQISVICFGSFGLTVPVYELLYTVLGKRFSAMKMRGQ